MTVKELIEELSKYPSHSEVLAGRGKDDGPDEILFEIEEVSIKDWPIDPPVIIWY